MILILLPLVFCQQQINQTLLIGQSINISFGLFIFAMNIDADIKHQESKLHLDLNSQFNAQFLNVFAHESNIFGLHQNCTLQIIFLTKSINFVDFQNGCISMAINPVFNEVLIFYPKEIIIYSLEKDFKNKINYNYSNNITEIRTYQQFILFSKGREGFDLLTYSGDLILNNFLMNTKIYSSSILGNKLILLSEEGLLIFNNIYNPKSPKLVKIDDGKKFIATKKFIIVQTSDKILEYIDEELNQIIECQSKDFTINDNFLYYIEDQTIKIKIIGINKNDFNLTSITTYQFPTTMNKISGFTNMNQDIVLHSETEIQIHNQQTQKSFVLFEGKKQGEFNFTIELFTKNCNLIQQKSEQKLTFCIEQRQVYITVIKQDTMIDGIMLSMIIVVCIMFLVLILYLIRRTYLKYKQTYREIINEQPSSDQIIIKQ